MPPTSLSPTRPEQIEHDFQVTAEEAQTFWHVFRDGLLHLASPMQSDRSKTLPAYSMRPETARFLEFEDIAGVRTLIVNPWLFCDRVLALWQARMHAIDANKSAPVPKRFRTETYYYTNSQCPSVTVQVEEP